MLRRLPFHPLLFSIYPVLALLAANLREVGLSEAVRPLLVSLAAGAGLFLLLWLALRNWAKAALLATLLLVLFFSYGHLYSLLEGATLFGANLGRHRFLIPVYLFVLAGGIGWMISLGRKARPEKGGLTTGGVVEATRFLNLAGIVLLAFPLAGIARYSLQTARAQAALSETPGEAPGSNTTGLEPDRLESSSTLPDIYYIILDGYTRGDALLEDLGYDNEPFLGALRGLGFYVAGCSRANYHYTLGSLTSTLNMDYLPALQDDLAARGLGEKDQWLLLKYNLVRSRLESLGYTTVAFESGFEWSRWQDAGIYLGRAQQSYTMQRITPFEAMLARSTALLPLVESSQKALAPHFQDINFPYYDHINRQLFILDQVPQIASNPAPTFTFVHLLIPHIPYVFEPDGEIVTDPGFYSGGKSEPVDGDYRRIGYTNEVQYVNARMLPILRTILDRSSVPPVIILQGDHGLNKDNRLKILNAYYVNEQARAQLTPSISPVNSFRVVFNAYFASRFPEADLLPDISYKGDETPQVVEETGERCK